MRGGFGGPDSRARFFSGVKLLAICTSRAVTFSLPASSFRRFCPTCSFSASGNGAVPLVGREAAICNPALSSNNTGYGPSRAHMSTDDVIRYYVRRKLQLQTFRTSQFGDHQISNSLFLRCAYLHNQLLKGVPVFPSTRHDHIQGFTAQLLTIC